LAETMRATVLSAPGKPVEVEEIPVPEPRHGEVLVRVEACGVCHTDLHVMKGDIAFPTPAVMGHEVAGTIVEVGDGVDGLAPGDRVVTTFIMPCGTCRHCAAGRDDLCERFFAMNRLNGTLYDGETRLRRGDGTPLAMYSMAGLAELAVSPATAVYKRPESLGPGESAILGCSFFTAYGAVRHRGAVVTGERVAVVGAGGIGTAIVQVASAFGASQVIAVDLAADKLALAEANGATATVNGAEVDAVAAVRDLTGGGADVVFEAIGLPATWRQGIEMVRDGGRFVPVGIAPLGVDAAIEITRIVRRSISIVGSYGGRVRADMPELLELVELGRLRPGELVTTGPRSEGAQSSCPDAPEGLLYTAVHGP
jgi:S-(hydroxymethyl)glutathione dehydrogenase/alcohol dehydrogenase